MVAHMALRVIISVWTAVAIISQAAPVRADAAEVEALIAKGNELRRAGTPGPALPYFQKAYELARTPRTAGQLGLAELAAGYPVPRLGTALEVADLICFAASEAAGYITGASLDINGGDLMM